jgi:hypothetical protein
MDMPSYPKAESGVREPMTSNLCYMVKVRGVFRLRNVNIVGFYYLFNRYMFLSYDHLEVDIYFLELTLLSIE